MYQEQDVQRYTILFNDFPLAESLLARSFGGHSLWADIEPNKFTSGLGAYGEEYIKELYPQFAISDRFKDANYLWDLVRMYTLNCMYQDNTHYKTKIGSHVRKRLNPTVLIQKSVRLPGMFYFLEGNDLEFNFLVSTSNKDEMVHMPQGRVCVLVPGEIRERTLFQGRADFTVKVSDSDHYRFFSTGRKNVPCFRTTQGPRIFNFVLGNKHDFSAAEQNFVNFNLHILDNTCTQGEHFWNDRTSTNNTFSVTLEDGIKYCDVDYFEKLPMSCTTESGTLASMAGFEPTRYSDLFNTFPALLAHVMSHVEPNLVRALAKFTQATMGLSKHHQTQPLLSSFALNKMRQRMFDEYCLQETTPLLCGETPKAYENQRERELFEAIEEAINRKWKQLVTIHLA